jgi:hypothetical protein
MAGLCYRLLYRSKSHLAAFSYVTSLSGLSSGVGCASFSVDLDGS